MTSYPLLENEITISKPYFYEDNNDYVSECNNCIEESNSFYAEVNEEFLPLNY
ncbi:MAG: hypothetical protein M0R46_04795 [Candidatus Muirbacterium halophilum]|nr:hypothetical protein [Candidatus Muirbacterium halophilum]MCK9475214.1 hypothetical protein [Candidatus Muirbacterium halophilum]